MIYQAREDKGLSSRKLAERIGVHHSAVGRIQLGQVEAPDPRILADIADALDISAAELFALAGYAAPSDLPDLSGYLNVKYRQLSDRDVRTLAGHLDYLLASADEPPRKR